MNVALTNGILGLGLCLGIGMNCLELTWSEVLVCVFASNLGAFLALLGTLKAERIPWLLKSFLDRSMKTWTLLITLYLLTLILVSIPLRDPKNLACLILPLILSTGFAIIVFGPVQDHFVRRQQRRTRAKELPFTCSPTD